MSDFPELPFCQEPDGRWRRDRPTPPALLCGAFNPLHAGHHQLAGVAAQRLQCPIAFELTTFNADKPPLCDDEIRARLRQFEWRAPVWLTPSSTFLDKATLFRDCAFVVGFDTADRVIEPRFYGSDVAMLQALQRLREFGCRFLVAGRVEGERFRTGDELPIPDSFRDLFESLSENEFRLDLSATKIRSTTQPG